MFVFMILSIPVGAYFISQQKTNFSASANNPGDDRGINPFSTPITSAHPSTSSSIDLNSSLQQQVNDATSSASPSPSSIPELTIPADTFGPTLNLKVTIEGRPLSNQASKLFIGIASSTQTSTPQYLLSFNIDMPASGSFTGLSLAGLTIGSNYTAYIKGQAQIATSSAFVMGTNVTNLNNIQALTLTSGDLNEDNVINSADYAIAKALYGATKSSTNWNDNADLNKDGVINIYDLAIIANNMGKTGASGVWQSTPVVSPTPSSGTPENIIPASGSAQPNALPAGRQGYWIWVPK